MNPMFLGLFGFVFGMIFGLLMAWSMLSPVVILIVMAVMLAGSFVQTPFRAFFATAIFAFLISWLVSSGVQMI